MAFLYANRFALSRVKSRPVFYQLRTASHESVNSCDRNVAVTPKNPAAVALGRRGGKARVQNQTLEQRIESARHAAQARWAQNEKRIDASLKEMKDGFAKLDAKQKARAKRAKVKQGKP